MREQAKFYQFTGIRFSDLKGHMLYLARDSVLFRVVNRVLKKIQSNRTQRAGGVPSYQELIETYSKEQDMMEHHIRSYFYPDSKIRDQPYPLSFSIKVTVVSDLDNTKLPGARIFVDNEWCATTWKDGVIVFPLETRGDDYEYDIVAKLVGFTDSATQTITETGDLVFRLVPE